MTAWRELAGRFAGRANFDSLEPEARDFLGLIAADRPLIVACSGGADSVYLVLALATGLQGAEKRLHIAHFNHGLRGEEADADAAFAEELAAGLGLPFHLGRAEAPLEPDEASLRAARYAWLDGLYEELDAAALCLGHHGDDLLESLLMALLSGSGPGAMASPMPVNRFPGGKVRLRPLLSLKRGRIESALQKFGIPWREDPSNQDPTYTRNWLRLEIVPRLRERFPQDIHAGTRRTRALMEECVNALDAAIERLELDRSRPDSLPAGPLEGQPEALIRRAFYSWWLAHHPDFRIPAPALDAVVRILRDGATDHPVSIGQGRALVLGGDRHRKTGDRHHESGDRHLNLVEERETAPSRWAAGGSWYWRAGPLYLPDGHRLEADLVRIASGDPAPWERADPACECWLEPGDSVLAVRQWEPGDRYRPLGAPGRRKLQDLFVDRGFDIEQKHRLPVLIDRDGSVLWVPGFPPAEALKVHAGAITALKLTYQ